MTRRGPRGPLNCLYDEAFAHMEHSVDALASVVPAPRSVKMGGGPRVPLRGAVASTGRGAETRTAGQRPACYSSAFGSRIRTGGGDT